MLKQLGKGARNANLMGAVSSSELECREEKKFSTAARGFILATLNWQRMRTSGRGTAASSCVASCVATLDAAALPRRQSTPLPDHCSRPHPLSLSFCKIRPNFELKTKFHQNKSCSEFYKLQITFWCPRLKLRGKRLIWPNSLEFTTQFKEIQIFELGTKQGFQNYF